MVSVRIGEGTKRFRRSTKRVDCFEGIECGGGS